MKSPGSGESTAKLPPGAAQVKREPITSNSTSRARKSASSLSMPNVIASGTSSAIRRPYGSSTFTTAGPGSSNRRRFAAKYASIVSWKSRWSWVRFVKTRQAKRIPSARPSSSACEDTSMATATSPPSAIRRKVSWRSIASGVVRSTSSSTPPTTRFTVPSSPVWRPAASSRWRTRKAVVVLPFVPVIPTTSSWAVGSP